MANASFLALISFLVFSFFIAEIHGSKQGQVFDKFQKSKYKVDSQIDTSDFNSQEVVVDNHIVHSQKGLQEKDKIVKLPGQPHVNFSQYGGYVTIDKLQGVPYIITLWNLNILKKKRLFFFGSMEVYITYSIISYLSFWG
ncbi:putative carboxypeptidase D [Lupinus albus]|uniref:Putative carboxypeptidase D n=1 Tax=Lupinus albus TaxID=3870 RepID=A0A6A4NCM6_LUPAL|nr:putative carboxypeptidase D [Lupinus albus]